MEQNALYEAIINWYNALVFFGGGAIAIWFGISYAHTKSRPLLTSLPGIFTSLGLLGTFLSIVISLGGIKTSDFSMGDNSTSAQVMTVDQSHSNSEITDETIDVENGVQKVGEKKATSGNDKTIEIISDLVPAFTSSILGLIMAFVATVITKWQFAKEDALIDEKTDYKTPEENLYDICVLLEKQIASTEEYNQQVEKNIEDQNKILTTYLQGFEVKMGTIFDTMQTSITNQVDTIGEKQIGRAGEILNKISEDLAGVTKDILEAQKKSVQGLVSETKTQLQTMASSIASQYDLIKENANSNVVTMTALKEQYSKANTDILNEAKTMNKQVADDMCKSLKGFVGDISEAVKNECIQLHAALKSNINALDKAYKFIEERITQITSDYDQASLTYRDAVSVAHRQNESSENTINKAGESLKLLQETNIQIGYLLKALNERQDNVEILISRIHEMSSAIEALQKLEIQLKRLSK